MRVDNAHFNKATNESDEDMDEATSDTDNIVVENINFFEQGCDGLLLYYII